MSKYPMVRLEDVCDKATSSIAQKDLKNLEGIYPIYGASGFIKNINFYKQDREYIAIVKDGAGIGRAMILPAFSSVIGTMQYILPKDNIITKYLYFAIDSMNLAKYFTGATIPHIYFKDYKNEFLPLPPIENQRSIIKILESIVSLIIKRKQQLSEFDELAKSRFIEMFGDYFDNENILCKLQDICTATIGLTYKPTNVVPNGITVLRSGNIQNNELYLIDDIVQVDNIKINDDKFIRPYDILMCSRNGSSHLVGKSCLITETKERMTFGAFMTVIRSNYPYFTQGFFLSDFFKRQLTGTQTTSVNQITTKMLYNYHTIKPTEEEENRFASFIQQLDKSKFRMKKCLKLFGYMRHLWKIEI